MKFSRIILFIFLIFSAIGSSVFAKDPMSDTEIISMLARGGEDRRRAVWFVYQLNKHHLLRRAVSYLKIGEYEDHKAILNVLHIYGLNLESYLPDWYDFLDPFMNVDKPADVLLSCIRLGQYWKEHRLIYAYVRLAEHPNREVRLAAFSAMSTIGNDRLIPVLLRLVNSDKAVFRIYGLEGAYYYADARLAPFVNKLLNDTNPAVRIAAILAAGEQQGENQDLSYQVVKLYVSDPSPEVRERVVEITARKDWRKHSYIVNKAISDSHPDVRLTAIRSLEYMRDGQTPKFLSSQIAIEPEEKIRIRALDAFLILQNGGGGAGLSRMIISEDRADLRLRAVQVSARIKDKGTLQALFTALRQDTSAEVRAEAAMAIAELKEVKISAPVLMEAIKDEQETYDVRTAALLSILSFRSSELISELYTVRGEIKSFPFQKQLDTVLMKERGN